jgi:hypothetical protein
MIKTVLIFPALSVFLLFLALADGGSCNTKERGAEKSPQTNKKLATGAWGGQDIRLEVKDDGAHLQFACATATIDEPLTLNGEGGFDLKGKFIAQRPGPTRQGENNSIAARFVGHLKDQELTLTISNLETKEPIGTFTLTLGGAARVKRCH